ncbi:MAG: electron transfer flavoprotein subunit alpha/FixB family protein [Eggerthellaceae bacterium]|jgi:electron transfer flavoprotein alpha subunit
MAGVYIVADAPDTAAELVTYAKEWGKPSTVVVLCGNPSAYAQTGADALAHLAADDPVPENYLRPLASYLRQEQAEIVLTGAHEDELTVAAGVAGYLDCEMATDARNVGLTDDCVRIERSVYGGMVVDVQDLPLPCVVSVAPGKKELASGAVSVKEVPVETSGVVSRESSESRKAGSVDLTKAERVVCVGLGVKKREDLEPVRQLAQALGAELACTRSIVEERQWMDKERYIGITGSILSAKLYLAVGVSGQVQHMYGVRDVDTIMAIDTDEKAPIFKNADYGVVGDLYQVVPALLKACGE